MKVGTKRGRDICRLLDIPWGEKWLGLRIEPIKRSRSVEANALYWKIVGALAQEVGMSKDEMHREVLSEFHGYELVEFRGSVIKHPRGRSHNLSSENFSELLLIVEKWASEMGVVWDDQAA